MIISLIIYYTQTFAWLLPPFRQRGCKYFLYFLILALSDPIFRLIYWIHATDVTWYYLVISTLVLISLFRKKYLFLLLIADIIILIYLTIPEIRLFTFLLHFIIMLYFLKEFILIISKESKIVIFNLALVLYEVTLLFKLTASYFEFGVYNYYLTTAFEILPAVFFTIYNEKNSPSISLQMEPNEIN